MPRIVFIFNNYVQFKHGITNVVSAAVRFAC